MTEAARRAGATNDGIRRALQAACVALVAVTPRAYAVEEADLAAFIQARAALGYLGRGRPKGSKNKPHPP